MEVEHNGDVVVASDTLSDVVSHIGGSAEAQWTTKIKQGEMVINCLENFCFSFGQRDFAAITLTTHRFQLLVRNLLDECECCNDNARHDRRDEVDKDSETQH